MSASKDKQRGTCKVTSLSSLEILISLSHVIGEDILVVKEFSDFSLPE